MINWTDAQKDVLTGTGNMLVSASAGSGKTTIMLERVLSLVKSGYDLNRFLIMTFSNASAAEMREKLIQKLYDELRSTGNNHLKKQLELLNFSNISTIHSFCLNLYKKYFADIGYDSAFELMDDKESLLLFWDCADKILETYFEQDDKLFFELCERFVRGRDILPLKEVIKSISDFLDVQVDEEEYISKAIKLFNMDTNSSPAIKYYLQHHKRLLRRYESAGCALIAEVKRLGLKDSYIDIINNINTNLENVYKSKNLDGFAIAVNGLSKVANLPGGKKDDLIKELVEEIKEFKDTVGKYLNGLQETFSDYYLSGKELRGSLEDVKKLLELTVKVKKEYQRQKAKKRRFDFADLSKVALKILEDKNRREQISSLFDFVFIDEYQDTDHIQERLMTLISQKNNLFMVGDPKQAIYQFRHAEPKIFIDRYYRYQQEKEGKNQNLNDNFRSDKRVLDFVNLVFNEVMNSEFGGVDYKNKAELVAGLEYPVVSSLPAVEVATYCDKEKSQPLCGVYSVKNNSVRQQEYSYEGNYIADTISEMVSRHYIYDTSIKEKRLVEYKDIAILMYKRKNAGILDELKKRGIPYSAPGFTQSRVYEIHLLVDFLRIIDNMANDIPLSTVMHSPLYNFSPNEMLEIRNINKKVPFWHTVIGYKGTQNIENKINNMIIDLERYRNMSSYCNVYELMLRILAGGYDSYLLSKGEETIETVNTFINSVKGKEYSRNITSFLEYFDNVYKNDITVPAFGNAVKIMTIHASKGLEFPIVFVARADAGFTSTHDNTKDVYMDTDFGIAIKYYDSQNKIKNDTILTKSFKLKSHYKEKEELMRLMYVALTRARNHLFIVGGEKKHKEFYADMQGSFMEWINLAKEKNSILNKYFVDLTKGEDICLEKDNFISRNEDIDLSSLSFSYDHKESTVLPSKYSVSSLKNHSEEPKEEKIVYLTEEERIERGIAYHKILEHIDFHKPERENIEKELKDFVFKGIITEQEMQGIDISTLENIMKSEIFELARKSTFFREKQFMLYVPMNEVVDGCDITEKILVQGVIDLLILGEKNIVVDFKVTQSGDEAIRQRYEKQLKLYSLAVEKLMKIKVDKTVVYVVNRNKVIEL